VCYQNESIRTVRLWRGAESECVRLSTLVLLHILLQNRIFLPRHRDPLLHIHFSCIRLPLFLSFIPTTRSHSNFLSPPHQLPPPHADTPTPALSSALLAAPIHAPLAHGLRLTCSPARLPCSPLPRSRAAASMPPPAHASKPQSCSASPVLRGGGLQGREAELEQQQAHPWCRGRQCPWRSGWGGSPLDLGGAPREGGAPAAPYLPISGSGRGKGRRAGPWRHGAAGRPARRAPTRGGPCCGWYPCAWAGRRGGASGVARRGVGGPMPPSRSTCRRRARSRAPQATT
jgi:hypothetical protein